MASSLADFSLGSSCIVTTVDVDLTIKQLIFYIYSPLFSVIRI